jgi:hypothetical protein
LHAPATRKVAAGLLIEPRFRWTYLGDVVGRLGFSVQPGLGGNALVPGSAREVPAWLLAGPVLRRLAALLAHRRRGFVTRTEVRASPRGRIDWSAYASTSLPSGRWHHLPCTFSEPDDDPRLMAAVRWTLDRVTDSLATLAPTPIGRLLLDQAEALLGEAGPGPRARPQPDSSPGMGSAWLAEATQAMGWVAEERGLGGSRTLDGLAWDLAIDVVWEQWVAHIMSRLAPRLGLSALSGEQARHGIQWQGRVHSMGSLVPDVGLRAPNRTVWVDAKYKAHLTQLARSNWPGLTAQVRESHRADLHQALAYAALANVDQVDTVLAYPLPPHDDGRDPPSAVATLTAGRRRVRLHLAGLPFGFRSATHEEATLDRWRKLLAA